MHCIMNYVTDCLLRRCWGRFLVAQNHLGGGVSLPEDAPPRQRGRRLRPDAPPAAGRRRPRAPRAGLRVYRWGRVGMGFEQVELI